MSLNEIWFLLLGVLLAGYAILDGFDFGVGIIYLFAKSDEERRILLNSIGPLWDGNEVWLVTFGGALFAAFPNAYALAFSGFYLLFMMLLLGLIFRAVSIEFRSKHSHGAWRTIWDWAFSLSSYLCAFTFGIMAGHSFSGMPVGQDMEFHGTVLNHFTPYTMLTGSFAVAVCAMHGSIYAYLKTENELQDRIYHWMWTSFGIFLVMYMLTTIVTLIMVPRVISNFTHMPWVWAVVFLNVLAIGNIPRSIYTKQAGWAFISSMVAIAGLITLFGVALYPNLVVSSISPSYNMDIYTAASSQKTLGIMLIIAILGLPFVLSYTAVVYWIFRGKVKLGKFSY
jgi:cytochrome d ubiquinol oxidase subunit II